MSEITQEVEKPAEEKKFNPADFAGKPTKETTTEKKDEPKVEVQADEISFDFEEEPKGDDKPTIVGKGIFDRFKEIEPDVKDEEEIFTKYKSVKEENDKLRIVSKGRDLIDNDADIKNWKDATRLSDAEKAETALYLQFTRKGYGQEEALERAKEKLAEYEENDVKKIRDEAVEFTAWLNSEINKKTKFIEDEILKNTVKLDVDEDVQTRAGSLIRNTTEFLGMTLPKDEATRTKALKKAEDFDLSSAMKDPAMVAKVKMFLAHEDTYIKNIKQRSTSKLDVIEKLDKAAPIKPTNINRSTEEKPRGFNPHDFTKKPATSGK